jgi:lipoprotein-anchoring transpeptidase ErfK/SrfK
LKLTHISKPAPGGFAAVGMAAIVVAGLILLFSPERARAQEQQAALAAKRVIVDKTRQLLSAYEGERLVLESRVSTGRRNSTPNGSYRVQGKQRMHYSRLYENAPMPYSVQVSGHYFIHGFSHVPNHAASHGCIRLPLSEGNPAREFYDWVEVGTPVEIIGRSR